MSRASFILILVALFTCLIGSTLEHPDSTRIPKTLDDAIKIIRELDDKQKKLDREIREIYQMIVDNNDDIPITYEPEIIDWLRKLNQQDRKKHWKFGYQFQGYHPGYVPKYNKDFTRALVIPVSHAKQYSDRNPNSVEEGLPGVQSVQLLRAADFWGGKFFILENRPGP